MAKRTNRKYKDRLFKFIFGNPKNKAWTLSLYNAVNGSNYTDENAIEINTIEDAVYMEMKNDVSFLINDTMNLYEHQSSFNPNMPMRFFIYGGMLYDKFVEESDTYDLYSPKLQKAPAPRCICFFNGTNDKDDVVYLRLSDSFGENAKSDIEVVVKMININYGRSKEVLDSCKPLRDYSWFVSRVSENRKNRKMNLTEAIDEALDEMPDDSVIKGFLLANRAEVKRMSITEFNRERHEKKLRAECKAEGMAKGMAKGALLNLAELVEDGLLTPTQAAKKAGMTKEKFKAKVAALKKELQLN